MTDAAPTQPSSKLKISETILKTGRMEEMRDWYRIVLGVDPFFERVPPADTRPLDLGGQTRASDLKMCFFRLSLDHPYVQSIGIFEEPGTALEGVKGTPGLHHMQLMTADLDALCDKFDELGAQGLRPHRSSDHGVMTSFYYRDPDGNNVEITAQNHASMGDMVAFMGSDEFKANPSGHEIPDPDAFVAQRRARTGGEMAPA